MAKHSIGVIGLHMGRIWVQSAAQVPDLEIVAVHDKRPEVAAEVAEEFGTHAVGSEEEFFASDAEIVVVATPDPFHVPHSVAALEAGKHVICEKPLALTVAECRQLIDAVGRSDRYFMVGQICRFVAGFKTAKHLVERGEIGELAFVESEYAHDYTHAPGVGGWRKDPAVQREGFIGGGCHALDLLRWIAGDPEEVFCYTNHKLLTDWPTADTGVAIFKLPGGVIGKVFVSVGARRPYTMRTVLYGTEGTIVCDNTSPAIQIFRQDLFPYSGTKSFCSIPVSRDESHRSGTWHELEEFVACLDRGKPPATDVIEGTKTVAFGEAALLSARTGRPVRLEEVFAEGA